MELFGEDRGTATRTSDYIRFAAVLERMPVGVGIYTQAGDLFYSNRLFGFGGEKRAPSRTPAGERWRAFDPQGAELGVDHYPCARALRGEIVPSGTQMSFRDAAGHDAWFSVAAIPLRSRNSSSISGAVMITQNIDERRQLAAELVASELRFHQFAENSRNALLITDPVSGRVEYASPSVAEVFGMAAAPAEAHELDDRLHAEDRAAVLMARDRVAAGDVQRFDYRVLGGSDTRARRLSETCFPIRHPGRDTLLVGSIVEDVSREAQVALYAVGGLSGSAAALIDTGFDDWTVKRFATLDAFAEIADVLAPGCLLIDLSRTGPADLLRAFDTLGIARFPIVLLGAPDLNPAALRSLASPAGVRLLTPPFEPAEVVRAAEDAVKSLAASRTPPLPDPTASDVLSRLSRREAEVMNGLLKGGTNKVIARDLGISPRTVELHRSRLMDRLKVRSLSELLRVALSLRGQR